jgi:DNA-binding CsgD family transcriptional regulator
MIEVDGEELAVLSHPLARGAPLSGLTVAESEIAAAIVDGRSNGEIGRLRQTSERTVAKQVASIFRKLGIGSRRQLVALTRGRVHS